MPGLQHLDGDGLQRAIRHPHLGLVHLGDRGRGNGRSEFGVELIDRAPESLLDRFARIALREGRQAVLKRGEIGGELPADDVVAGGEELAELDVGRPERGERGRELRLVAVLRGAVLAERRGHAAEQSERRGQVRILGKHARATPGEDRSRLGQPRHVGDVVHSHGLITVARRSGWRRSRRSDCGSARARSPHSRSAA